MQFCLAGRNYSRQSVCFFGVPVFIPLNKNRLSGPAFNHLYYAWRFTRVTKSR
jgi:hypothetical protein